MLGRTTRNLRELIKFGRSAHTGSSLNNKNLNCLVFLDVLMVIMELFVIKMSMSVNVLVYVYVQMADNVSIILEALLVTACWGSLVKTVLWMIMNVKQTLEHLNVRMVALVLMELVDIPAIVHQFIKVAYF